MVVAFESGALVLEEGGEPARWLFVVREGAIDLELQGETLDVLGPGESFGFPSLMTGDRPAFDVRARGETTVLRIERAAAERWLGSAPGLRFIAMGLRHRAELAERADRSTVAPAIAAARSTPELVARASAAVLTLADLHDEGLGVRALGREVARVIGAATTRAIDLYVAREAPPTPWAWLVFGSVARRESGLVPDQDHTIVWQGDESDDPYFAGLAEAVTSTLEQVGWPRCPAGVLATSMAWRGPLDRWMGGLLATAGSELGAFRLALALDARKVAGPLRVEGTVRELWEEVRSGDVRWRVARHAIGTRPPIGAFGGLETERRGGRRVVDVKQGGLLAVTDLGRFAALEGEVEETSTVERLRRSADRGSLATDAARSLEEAFDTFSELRFARQVECLRGGELMDSLVEPAALDPVTRIRLREAFRVVDAAQADLRAASGGGRFHMPSAG